MASTLNWRGDDLKRRVLQQAAAGLTEFGLRCETGAKRRLRPSEQDASGDFVPGGGHGVRTGTLRRSIHTATPGYGWDGDNVEPSSGAPERGGQAAKPREQSGRLTLELGTGMEYGLEVHQSHYDATVFHFIVSSVEQEAPKLPGILKRHMASGGLLP